ncbi:MAG: hypothetical protein EBT61_18160 [Verrucomicrobia bacterium]|nr:hypothetical protein [Verrucomicrobiota bacterium]
MADTIHADKLCALTGLTDRRHRQLAKAGYFPPPDKSEYQLAATIKGLFQYYREQKEKRGNSDERIKKARAEKLEIGNEVLRRDLLPAEEVRRDIMRGFGELKSQLLTIPRRVSQSLAIATDPVTIEESLNKEIVGVLEATSRQFAERDK